MTTQRITSPGDFMSSFAIRRQTSWRPEKAAAPKVAIMKAPKDVAGLNMSELLRAPPQLEHRLLHRAGWHCDPSGGVRDTWTGHEL
jgi:hypothetical protein